MAIPEPDALPEPLLGKSLVGNATFREHAMRGFAWNSAWRWAVRILSILNTAILARLLSPYDFGVYAMTMIVVNFVEIFTQTGHLLALIRMKEPTREHLDTAWTLQVLTGLLLSVVIILVAPLARRYFGVEQVETLLYFISLRTVIGGFANVGTVGFRINMDFAKEFQLGVLQRLLFVALVLTLAATLGNYWALAIGVVGGNVILVALSYWMHPYRPRFSLAKLKEIWSFSIWVLIGYVSGYVGQSLDALVVGGLVTPTQMGYYDAAAESAIVPVSDLLDPISRALFPIYSHFLDDPERLLEGYLNSLSVAAAVALPTSIGLALVAHDFIDIQFGTRWDDAADILRWLAFSGIGLGLAHGIPTVLNAAGRLGLSVAATWIRIIIVLPALLVAGHFWGMIGIAVTQSAVLALMVPVWFLILARVIPITFSAVLARLWRPTIAAAVLALAVEGLFILMPHPSVIRLAAAACIGAGVFSAVLMALWASMGRPDGVEQVASSLFQRFCSKIYARLRTVE